MTAVAMTVNGKPVTGDVDPRTLLVQFLRENLRLTGTHGLRARGRAAIGLCPQAHHGRQVCARTVATHGDSFGDCAEAARVGTGPTERREGVIDRCWKTVLGREAVVD